MKRAQRVQTGRTLAVLAAAVWFGAAAADAAVAGEPVDLGVLHQIKQEALRRSKLMEVASTLTDVHGPRLTGSPQLRAAGDYLVKIQTHGPNGWPSWQIVPKSHIKGLQ